MDHERSSSSLAAARGRSRRLGGEHASYGPLVFHHRRDHGGPEIETESPKGVGDRVKTQYK